MSEGGFVVQTSYSKLTQAMKAQHQQGKDLSSIIIFHNHLSLSLSRASLCAQAIHEEQEGVCFGMKTACLIRLHEPWNELWIISQYQFHL